MLTDKQAWILRLFNNKHKGIPWRDSRYMPYGGKSSEKKIGLLMGLMMVFGLSTQAHATLYVRGTDSLGNQLIYDSDLDITWYDYTYSTPYFTSWGKQMYWASALTVDFYGTNYDDWRLPTAFNQDGTGPCYYYNCNGSEMGYLYYTEMGNVAGGPLTNTDDFQNLTSSYYWSGTTFGPYGAWGFRFLDGRQDTSTVGFNTGYALAVREGDVVAVPEPSTMLFLGSGLAGLGFVRRRFTG